MSLEAYRRKRTFTQTPEPKGRVRHSSHSRIFVVQKHDARRLHYDFRLAINAVLVSWAVPKGPSMNPADKRLAIRTEDHPLEYANFEGVIPAGQYGAGTVMVWDRGRYLPQDDIPPDEQLDRGKIDVVLEGQKLHGGFTLIRTGKPSADPSQRERWLLIKQHDERANPAWNIERPELDRSVLTARQGLPASPDRRAAHRDGTARPVLEASAREACVTPVTMRLTPSSRPVAQSAVAGQPSNKTTPTTMLQMPAATSQPHPGIGRTIIPKATRKVPSAKNRTAINTASVNAPPSGYATTSTPAIA